MAKCVCVCECVYVCAGVEQKVYKLILKNVVNTQKFLATFTQKQQQQQQLAKSS